MASIFLNGASTDFKLLHFLSNYLGFLLSPIMIAFFAASIGKFHRLKGAVIGIGVFSLIHLQKQKEAHNASSVLADVWVGLRYVYSHVIVRKTLLIYGLFVFFTVPAGYLSGLLVKVTILSYQSFQSRVSFFRDLLPKNRMSQ